MPSKKVSAPVQIYQLKITLVDSKPPIWRRVLVADDTRLSTLHLILQIVMPWSNSHLHQFLVGGEYYSNPDFDLEDVYSENDVRLNQLGLAPKARFRYEYDFGDGWDHDILVEKILDPDPGSKYPQCIKGVNACPPDDCGGIWGYYRLLETLSDPKNRDYEDMLEWVGGEPIDPEAFDIDKVNRMLRKHVKAK